MMCTRSLGKVIIYEHIMYSLGHSSSLQDLDSVEDPIQSNQDPGLGWAQICCRVKSAKENSTLPS
jgi:hypothetical protein